MKNKAKANFKATGTLGYVCGKNNIPPIPMYITAIRYPKTTMNFEKKTLLNNILPQLN
jgi:hypothetical protein